MHLSDVLVLVVDYDVLLEDLLPKQPAHPLKKRARLVIKELDVFVPLFVDEERDIHLQIMRQFIQKFVHFLVLIILSILQRPLTLLIQLVRQIVILFYFVQNLDLLMKYLLLMIHLRDNYTQGPVRKREADDADDHDEGAKPSLLRVGGRDVTVPNCCDRRDGPVEAQHIKIIASVRAQQLIFREPILVLHAGNYDEEAGDGVAQDHEHGHEEN